MIRSRFLLATLIISLLMSGPVATAALPKEVRRELSQMSKEARKISGLVRRKKIDEAKQLISKLEERLEQLNISDDERDRNWTSFWRTFERARDAIPIRFESEIAPILGDNCARCHGAERAAANLRLDTFNGLRRGGRSGRLLQPRSSARSLIMARLTANEDNARMPRNSDPLPQKQISQIAKWIDGGAIFDGDDQDAPIGSAARPKKPNVKVTMADGSESVSFTKDVAPIIVTFCLNCHRGNNPRGGFSVVTIGDMLRGGDTGDTIIPGNADDSYLWHLVGLQDPIKMPQGNALLKRSQARTLRTWINEGAHFDGDDPSAALRSLVPTEAEKTANRLSGMSKTAFRQRRREQAESLWKRAASQDIPDSVVSDNFIVCGDVGSNRLNELSRLAETQAARLQKDYQSNDELWRGRLIIFASKDRFEYTEFNVVLQDRRTPPGVHGHTIITPQLDTAYVVLHDRTDADSSNDLTSNQLLQRLIAEAWLNRTGTGLPDWLQQGFGMTEADLKNDFFRRQKPSVQSAVAALNRPDDLFRDATLPPAATPLVGSFLVRFLQTQGQSKFTDFVASARAGNSAADAIQTVYGKSAASIARAFVKQLNR